MDGKAEIRLPRLADGTQSHEEVAPVARNVVGIEPKRLGVGARVDKVRRHLRGRRPATHAAQWSPEQTKGREAYLDLVAHEERVRLVESLLAVHTGALFSWIITWWSNAVTERGNRREI